MNERDFRLQVDPDGTLWLDVRDRPDAACGADMVLLSGSDPDNPASEITLSGRDLAEVQRLVDIKRVSDGYRDYK